VNFKLMSALTAAALVAASGCEKKESAGAKDAAKSLTDAGKAAGDAMKDAGKAVTDGAKDAASKAGDAVKETADKAKDAVTDAADKAKDKAGEVVAAVTEKAKEALKGYMDGLTGANSTMEKIKSPVDATGALAAITDAVKKVNLNQAILAVLPEGEKTALLGENKDALGSLTSTFKGHVERLTKDAGIGKILGDALKGFKLWE
jgi:gas vesicle protein